MELSRRRHRQLLGWAIFVALVVRAGAAVWWQERLGDARFAFGDSESYWTMSRALARGEPFQYGSSESRIFRTPGYPAVLAPLFLVFGDDPPVLAARWLGAALGIGVVVGAAAIGTRLFDGRTGLACAAWAAIYPGAIGMSVFVLSESAFCPLMMLNLWLWIVAWRSERTNRCLAIGLASGAAAGIAILVRPSWLLFWPLVVAAGLAIGPDRIRHLKIGVAVGAGIIIVMCPWWARNYRITGKFVLTNLQVGATLYDSLRPGATGASDANMEFVPEFIEAQRADDEGVLAAGGNLESTFEYRLDRRMKRASLDWARRNPAEAFRLAWVKMRRMWSPFPHADEMQSGTMRLLIAAGFLPIVLCGALGIWKYVPRGWDYAICLMPAVYFSLLHAVFIGSIRYRQPAMLTLIVLAAAAVVGVWDNRRKGATCAG